MQIWALYVQALTPALAALLAALASVVAYVTYRQRKLADDRAEWWRRVQYAMELVLSNSGKKTETGMQLLDHMSKDKRSLQADLDMIQDVGKVMVTGLQKASLYGVRPRHGSHTKPRRTRRSGGTS